MLRYKIPVKLVMDLIAYTVRSARDHLFPARDPKDECAVMPEGFLLPRLRCIKNNDHPGEHKDRYGFTWPRAAGDKKRVWW